MITGSKQLSKIDESDSFKNRLLYLVKNGLWKELEKEAVSFKLNGSAISEFSDDVWDFSAYKVGTGVTLLNFRFPECDVSPRMVQELKVVALAFLYHSRHAYRIGTIRAKIDCLKKLVVSLSLAGTFSLDGLTINVLKNIIKNEQYSPREIDLGPINSLSDLADFLSFSVNFTERLTLKKLRIQPSKTEQHPVIPLRIYLSALRFYTDEIQYWHTYKDQLESIVQTAFDYEKHQANRMLNRLRYGQCKEGHLFNNADKKYIQFITELKKNSIPLVDYGKDELWNVLWKKCKPQLRTDFFEPFPIKKIGKVEFHSHHEVKDFCRNLDAQCRYLVLCLSGMRSNELLQITPEFGAQVVTLDGIDIHIFHTKQQKITLGYQGHDDVYVTTRTGHLAYELLNALNRPIRSWQLKLGQKGWLLNTFYRFDKPYGISSPSNVLASLVRLFTSQNLNFSVELNSDDIEMLRRSDPEKIFNLGDKWHLTPHQLRRSLAYYLVGMQLADYPQLKQQFSHYSIAMTMYYARNASSFSKMYHDLENEKVRQQAKLYSDLTSKAMCGVKLGGGRGKNMFVENFTDRNISLAYFEKEIRLGRKHIHALAPGMYCINHTCSMRIGIDLPECTDCDWSIIESAAYAKAAKQESICILETLKSRNELSPDIEAFHTIRINAAEKIMLDMELDFEQYQLSANTGD